MYNVENEEEKKLLEEIVEKRKASLHASKKLLENRELLNKLHDDFINKRRNDTELWSKLFNLLDDTYRLIDIILIRNTSIDYVRKEDKENLKKNG